MPGAAGRPALESPARARAVHEASELELNRSGWKDLQAPRPSSVACLLRPMQMSPVSEGFACRIWSAAEVGQARFIHHGGVRLTEVVANHPSMPGVLERVAHHLASVGRVADAAWRPVRGRPGGKLTLLTSPGWRHRSIITAQDGDSMMRRPAADFGGGLITAAPTPTARPATTVATNHHHKETIMILSALVTLLGDKG
jgi:hypothetical protein